MRTFDLVSGGGVGRGIGRLLQRLDVEYLLRPYVAMPLAIAIFWAGTAIAEQISLGRVGAIVPGQYGRYYTLDELRAQSRTVRGEVVQLERAEHEVAELGALTELLHRVRLSSSESSAEFDNIRRALGEEFRLEKLTQGNGAWDLIGHADTRAAIDAAILRLRGLPWVRAAYVANTSNRRRTRALPRHRG